MRPVFHFGIVLLCSLACSLDCRASSGDTLSFKNLNSKRIQTDMTGMKVLATWGIINTLEGIIGSLNSDQSEWKHFHQMNAAWGVVNLSIAGLGYMGARKEFKKVYGSTDALHRYESTKRLYLINAGLDGLYISTGVFLNEYARRSTTHSELFHGFGKSLMLQGAGLLLFDISMFSAHHHQDKAWYKAMKGICLTEQGIGWRWVMN